MSIILSSAPPRFRAEPLSADFVRLVDVIFAVTLTQTLVVYRNEIVSFSPPLLIVTLAIVYMTVALSWVGYHRSISKYPCQLQTEINTRTTSADQTSRSSAAEHLQQT